MIKFHCPNCDAKISAEPEHGGQEATCPSCEQSIEVPSETESETPIVGQKAHPKNKPRFFRKWKRAMSQFAGVAVGVAVIFGTLWLTLYKPHRQIQVAVAKEETAVPKNADAVTNDSKSDAGVGLKDPAQRKEVTQPSRKTGWSSARESSALAYMKSLYPEYSNEQLIQKLKALGTGTGAEALKTGIENFFKLRRRANANGIDGIDLRNGIDFITGEIIEMQR